MRIKLRTDGKQDVEIDIWRRIGNHLAAFPHPLPAVAPHVLAQTAINKGRARRDMRRSRPLLPGVRIRSTP